MVEKGKRYELRISDFTHTGEGVAKVDGFAVFVPGAMPGEKVLIRITEKKRNYGRGLLLERLTVSPQRREPPCPIYEQCGGCQVQHLTDSAQLEMKRHKVDSALRRIGGVQAPEVREVWGMDNPWRYRSKVTFAVRDNRLGYYGAKSHHFVPVEDCLLLPEDMVRCKHRLEVLLRDESIHPEKVVIRKSHAHGTLQAIFYGARMGHHHLKVFGDRIQSDGCLSSAGWVDQERNRYAHLFGPDVLEEVILGLNYRISPVAFVQVNHSQMENLYGYALEKTSLRPTDTVLDLYCGIGAMTCLIAREAGRVIGIDEVHSAIVDGEANARNNGMENVTYLTGRVEEVLPELVAAGTVPDVVFLDPPRAGAKPEVLDVIRQAGPREIMYISCDPATLARDLSRLCHDDAYRISLVKPVDMFPQTYHVETVCLLTRK